MPVDSQLADVETTRKASLPESASSEAGGVTAKPQTTFTVTAAACRVFSYPILLGVLLAGGAIVGARFNLPDPDMWSHIAIGREILASHAWPTTDSYSFTAQGSASPAFEWLGDILIALAARGGLVGLMRLLAGLSIVLILLLYGFAYQRSHNAKAAFVSCLLALPLMSGFFTLRPQLLGYMFLLIAMMCLEAFRQGRRKTLWVLPPLFAVWVNTHGSFILGLLVLGLYWASGLIPFHWGSLRADRWTDRERRDLDLAALFSLLALGITPYGTRLAGFALHVILNAKLGMAHITEYKPLGASGNLLEIMMALLLPFLLAQLAFRPNYRVEELGLFLVAFCGAMLHSRLLFLFALAFAPLLATLLARWLPPYKAAADRPIFNVLLMLVVAGALAGFFPSSHDLENEVQAKYPQKALEYLREHPINGPMFNEYGWGGYLMWASGPDHKVFIDGRSQLYEEAGVYGDYLRMMALDPATLPLVRKYNLQAFLLDRNAPLATLLGAQPDWQIVYSDQVSTIVIRKRRQQSAKSDHPTASVGRAKIS